MNASAKAQRVKGRTSASVQGRIAELRELVASARWAIALAWSTNRGLFTRYAAVSLSRSLIPALLAIAARGVVNSTLAAVGSGSIAPIVPWIVLGLCFTALEGITALATRLLSQRMQDDLNYRVTGDLLEHTASLDVAQFENPDFRDVLERARRNPAEQVSHFLTDVLSGVAALLQVGSLFAILVFIEPLVLIAVGVFALPYLWDQLRLSRRHFQLEHSRATKRRWSSYFVSLLTDRASVSEVKLLGLAPLLIERFRALIAEIHAQDRVHYLRAFLGGSAFVIATTAAIFVVFLRVAVLVVEGRLSLGDLAIFGGAATRLRSSLELLITSFSSAVERTLHVSNIIHLMAAEPRARRGTTGKSGTGAGEIVLDDVTFAYPGSKEPALDGVSLRIGSGETVAFVGENGAGKTTLVKLIARLYDADRGRILIDGIDVREYDPQALHRHLAFVFQSFGRYEASAADNIAYGDWRRLLNDREQVRGVAALASVADLIERLPDGYDTRLGRNFGQVDLSGGEWQKIAVARAYARNATILILDEPTSNLDVRAEHALFRAFRELARGRTTILISHRFSTVSMADRIIVLERGRIIESGTHDELLARKGNYAELFDLSNRQRVPERR